jgi:glycine/D-amino acid oxidase-like deaminating enzyme
MSLDRRQFTQAVAATLVAAGTSRAAPARLAGGWDVIVVGAGSFGAWTAQQLLQRGHRVLLVDAYGPGNSLSSSGDQSRITRSTYGDRTIYSRWAAESLPEWQALERRSRTPIFQHTGVLAIIPRNSGHAEASTSVLTRLQIPFEVLSAREAMARFPQFHIDESETTIFEPRSGALYARGALAALTADMQRHGLEYRLDRVRPITEEFANGRDHLSSIATVSGTILHARHFVFACGPWLPKVFPEVIGSRITTPRAEAYFLRIPPGSRQYEPGVMPTWFDTAEPDAFGFPNLENRGCKVAVDAIDPPADPDDQDRRPTAPFAEAVRAYVSRRLPGLADAPFIESRVCQYEVTDNEHYLIDRHPTLTNVWIAGGGSGHGYKNGPAVGRYVADLIDGHAARVAEFALSSHQVATS